MQSTMKKIVDYLSKSSPMKNTFFDDKNDIDSLMKDSVGQNLNKFIKNINEVESKLGIEPKSTQTQLSPATATYLAKSYPSFDANKDGKIEISELKLIISSYKKEVATRFKKKTYSSLNDANAFQKWATNLWNLEGGDVGLINVKHDKGGYTNAGITIGTWKALAPKVLGIKGNVETLRNMTKKQWLQIVKHWWDENGGKDINNKAVAAIVVDTIWGSGNSGVCNVVQKVLVEDFGKEDIAQDCNLGSKTIKTINEISNQALLFRKLVEERKQFMNRIVSNNPTQRKFIRGWQDRIDKVSALYNEA